MDSKQFRVYNLTRKSYVSLRVVTVDDAAASLDKLLEQICEETDRGVWLKPFRGLDLLPEFPRFDLLYLDKDNQVIESPGASPSYLSGLVSGQVASVLLLPDSSIQL